MPLGGPINAYSGTQPTMQQPRRLYNGTINNELSNKSKWRVVQREVYKPYQLKEDYYGKKNPRRTYTRWPTPPRRGKQYVPENAKRTVEARHLQHRFPQQPVPQRAEVYQPESVFRNEEHRTLPGPVLAPVPALRYEPSFVRKVVENRTISFHKVPEAPPVEYQPRRVEERTIICPKHFRPVTPPGHIPYYRTASLQTPQPVEYAPTRWYAPPERYSPRPATYIHTYRPDPMPPVEPDRTEERARRRRRSPSPPSREGTSKYWYYDRVPPPRRNRHYDRDSPKRYEREPLAPMKEENFDRGPKNYFGTGDRYSPEPPRHSSRSPIQRPLKPALDGVPRYNAVGSLLRSLDDYYGY